MEIKMFIVTIISVAIICCIFSFCFGYIKGFKKARKIDDAILEDISTKLKLMNNERGI